MNELINLFDNVSAFLHIPKDKIKAISIIVEGKYGDITYRIDRNEQKSESENKINILEKTNEKLRNEVNNLKNSVKILEENYKEGILSIERKYEDNHKKLNKLIGNIDKIINVKKNNDIKQKENINLKEKNQFLDEPKSKLDGNKILSKNSEEKDNN